MRTERRVVAFLCLLCAFLAPLPEARADAGDAPPPPFTLDSADDAVAVRDAKGTLLQSLPRVGDPLTEGNRDHFTFIEDMNFDGFPDIGVFITAGTRNIFYDCWLWRPDAKRFEKYDELSEHANLSFNPDAKTVRSYTFVSVGCHENSEHVWENGKLVRQSQTVQVLSEDGKNIVVGRFERDGGGELRLVSEETRAADAEEMPDNPGKADDKAKDESKNPSADSSDLFLPASVAAAKQEDAAQLANGEWWVLHQFPDSPFILESRRLPAKASGEESIRRLIREEWPGARDILVEDFPELSRKLSAPAFRATFLHGGNEDTRQFVAALVGVDKRQYWFVLNAPADAEAPSDANAPSGNDALPNDAASQNMRLKRDMEVALLALEFVKPGQANPWFTPGLPVLEAATLPGDDASVMTALIHLKRTAQPEEDPQLGDGKHAYRFDGIGTASGKPALLFSFGEDSPEKFTALRHFAVDADGGVYEMNVLSGSEYRALGENPPL